MAQIIDGGLVSGTEEATKTAYSLLLLYGAKIESFKDLSRAFDLHGAKLRAAGWAPERDTEPVNKVKECLLKMDPNKLSITGEECRAEMLMKWHSWTIEYFLWLPNGLNREQRKSKATFFANELLTIVWHSSFQPKENEDRARLARLWLFLVNDEVKEAEKSIEMFTVTNRKLEGFDLIARYKSMKLNAALHESSASGTTAA